MGAAAFSNSGLTWWSEGGAVIQEQWEPNVSAFVRVLVPVQTCKTKALGLLSNRNSTEGLHSADIFQVQGAESCSVTSLSIQTAKIQLLGHKL